ncbi:hypothetical protein QH494_01735 [Sphingomonas sp. AR_OL41]|uniref:hypothetical protein n=1 Tax=Sphingomonas sp. AR_OL41 TaxID=3042729 RepID=UPI00247FD52E|nr:hypothetical protein [Sphingomonas sp. AR_OL41]MDH7970888.1 hypothetical protein [Sphingomonas sp. AR_OL41]
MSTRISSGLLLALVLGGCGEQTADRNVLAQVEARQRNDAEERGLIVCAQHGSNDFARVCTVDRVAAADGLVLTVSHPDGSFHRLLVTKDGRGVIAADGAEKAVVTVIGQDSIEVALGGDRYRLPATVKGATARGS